MVDALDDTTLDDLREAIFAAYASHVRRMREGERVPPSPPEEKARRNEIDYIEGEILESRDLATFSALHLQFLSFLYAFWRELETAEDAEINAPAPDELPN